MIPGLCAAFAVLVVGGSTWLGHHLSLRRGRAMSRWAADRGWSYVEWDDAWCNGFTQPPFQLGTGRAAENVVTGWRDGVPMAVFDHVYKLPNRGRTPGIVRHTVVVAVLPAPLPTLWVDREGALDKVDRAVGTRDIELENDAFNRAFVVRGADRRMAVAVMHPQLMELLLRTEKPPSWRIDGWGVLWVGSGRTPVEQLPRLIDFVGSVAALVPRHLTRDP